MRIWMRELTVRSLEFQWLQVDLVGLGGLPHLMDPEIRIVHVIIKRIWFDQVQSSARSLEVDICPIMHKLLCCVVVASGLFVVSLLENLDGHYATIALTHMQLCNLPGIRWNGSKATQ